MIYYYYAEIYKMFKEYTQAIRYYKDSLDALRRYKEKKKIERDAQGSAMYSYMSSYNPITSIYR